MRSAGFIGAVTDGEDLRLVIPRDIETLDPGVYSLDLDNSGEASRRLYTGRVWDMDRDRWLNLVEHPQELVVRIMVGEVLPNLSESEGRAYNRREDGRGVVIMWVSELRMPDARESDFITCPE